MGFAVELFFKDQPEEVKGVVVFNDNQFKLADDEAVDQNLTEDEVVQWSKLTKDEVDVLRKHPMLYSQYFEITRIPSLPDPEKAKPSAEQEQETAPAVQKTDATDVDVIVATQQQQTKRTAEVQSLETLPVENANAAEVKENDCETAAPQAPAEVLSLEAPPAQITAEVKEHGLEAPVPGTPPAEVQPPEAHPQQQKAADVKDAETTMEVKEAVTTMEVKEADIAAEVKENGCETAAPPAPAEVQSLQAPPAENTAEVKENGPEAPVPETPPAEVQSPEAHPPQQKAADVKDAETTMEVKEAETTTNVKEADIAAEAKENGCDTAAPEASLAEEPDQPLEELPAAPQCKAALPAGSDQPPEEEQTVKANSQCKAEAGVKWSGWNRFETPGIFHKAPGHSLQDLLKKKKAHTGVTRVVGQLFLSFVIFCLSIYDCI